MKYTICGFSQTNFVNLGLDIIDIQIFRWFIDFFSTGKMVHYTETQDDGSAIIFSWVKYEAVINDLPCLGIHNTRVIGRRFDNLVNANLLEKKVKKTIQGTFTFFRVIQETLDDLLSSSNKPDPSSSPCNEPENQFEMPVPKSTDMDTNEISDDTTVQKSDMRIDKRSTLSTVPKSTAIISLYQANSSTTQKETAAAALPQEIFSELCLKSSPELILPTAFHERGVYFLNKQGLDDGYIPWVYSYALTKKPRDIRSYFMKVFLEDDIQELYKAQKKLDATSKLKTTVCPVCAIEFESNNIICPICGLGIDEMKNTKKIHYLQWINSLPKETRTQYENEKSKLLTIVRENGGSYEALYQQLNERFGYFDE